jgi:hypothetical protein
MKKNDIKIIGAVLVIALLFFLFNKYKVSKLDTDNLYIVINVDGTVYEKVSFDEEKEIEVKTDFGTNIVKVHDHGVEMTHANCPDQICVKTGFVTESDIPIVCLPNRVYVEIVDDTEDEIDAISE